MIYQGVFFLHLHKSLFTPLSASQMCPLTAPLSPSHPQLAHALVRTHHHTCHIHVHTAHALLMLSPVFIHAFRLPLSSTQIFMMLKHSAHLVVLAPNICTTHDHFSWFRAHSCAFTQVTCVLCTHTCSPSLMLLPVPTLTCKSWHKHSLGVPSTHIHTQEHLCCCPHRSFLLTCTHTRLTHTHSHAFSLTHKCNS